MRLLIGHKTMTEELGKNVILHGWEDHDSRIGHNDFYDKNPRFLSIYIAEYPHKQWFLAFFFHCIYLLSTVTAMSALAAWNSTTTELRRLFLHPWLSQDPTEPGAVSDRDSQKHTPSLGRGPAPLESYWTGFNIALCNLTHICRMQLNLLSSTVIKIGRWMG